MGAHHDHGQGADGNYGRAFAVGIGLNLVFVAAEIGYGFVADSVALLADAGHNLSDVLGLTMAWGAWRLAQVSANPRFTYGYRGSSILAALFNALFLLVASGGIAWEAIRRLAQPPTVEGRTIMAVAAVGIVVNGVTAWMFSADRGRDINIRGAFLHMAADAAVSAGVVVAGFLTLRTGIGWIDPAASLAIVAVILIGTWGLLRESIAMALAGVPSGIDLREVTAALSADESVVRVHHVHIWPTSTTETALTAHLVVPGGVPRPGLLREVNLVLERRFGIGHTTLQVEDEAGCPAHDHGHEHEYEHERGHHPSRDAGHSHVH